MLGLEKESIVGSDWQRSRRHKRMIHNQEELKNGHQWSNISKLL